MDNTKPAEPGKVWADRALKEIASGKTKLDISDCKKQILPAIKKLLSKPGGRNLIHRILSDKMVDRIKIASGGGGVCRFQRCVGLSDFS